MKALVTGASSGMGRDMAKYLYSLGYELYLVARDKKDLNREFKGYKNIHTYGYNLIIEEECVKLYKELKDENIDILINNAGFGDAGNFTETSLDKEMDMIDLNIKAYHILTKLFLRDFVKRDYGRILNVASMAGFMPGPYMATYYATKNYIVSLSLAIYEELKRDKSNVKISIFCPGPVNTNFNNVADVKFNISSLSLPLEAPSSATVTMAVISRGNCFNPLRSTESPVPPPKTTIFFILHLLIHYTINK